MEQQSAPRVRALELYQRGRQQLLATQHYGQRVQGRLREVLAGVTPPQLQRQRPTQPPPTEELLFIPRGVQVFFVSPSGGVTASPPGFLRVSRRSGQGSEHPSAILQVDNWIYPLTKSSTVLLCTSGVFMFPDPSAPAPGSYVGVVLSSQLPAADRQNFKDQLFRLSNLKVQAADGSTDIINLSHRIPLESTEERRAVAVTTEEAKPSPEWSEKVSNKILSGASRLNRGLVKSSENTSNSIHRGGHTLRQHITPQEVPTEVSPHVTRGLQVARKASGGAVRASQFLVDGICTAAGCVGRGLEPHVSRAVPRSARGGGGEGSKLHGARRVAVSSMKGVAAVWSGLEVASANVGRSVASETVTTVNYKYGSEAAAATDDALHCVANVGVAALTLDNVLLSAAAQMAQQQASSGGPEPHDSSGLGGKRGC